MNVSLTPELEKLVDEKVRTGRYHSASEVIREGLRLLQEKDELHLIRLHELRKQVADGLAQLDQGQGIPGEKVFAELREKSRKARNRKK